MPHDPEFVRIVEEQGRRPVGIPVLLFTDATLAATDDPIAAEAAITAGSAAAGDLVRTDPPSDVGRDGRLMRRAAEAIGVDIAEVELFTTDAYLLQSVAGHLTVEPDA